MVSSRRPLGVKVALVMALTVVFVALLFGGGALQIRTQRAATPWSFEYRQPERPVRAPPSAAPLGPPVRVIAGRVIDESRQPVAGAIIALYDLSSGALSRRSIEEAGCYCKSNTDGSFRIEPTLMPSDPILVTRHKEYVTQRQTVADGKAGETIEVLLRRGELIQGRVVAAADENGVAGVRIVARGVGAPPEVARSDVIPGQRAETQWTESTADGGFVLRGLRRGSYQLDAASPGLITLPAGVVAKAAWSFPMGVRSIVVQAGAQDVQLRVLPVAVGLVRIESTSGGIVPNPNILPLLKNTDFLPWTRSMGATREVVIANGQQVDGRALALPAGTVALLLVSKKWPIRAQTVPLAVYAAGFAKRTVNVPLSPAGARNALQSTIVRMTPTADRGHVRFRAVDRMGRSVGPLADRLFLRSTDGGTSCYVKVRFDEGGYSDIVSLALGTYEVATQDVTNEPVAWRSDVVEARRVGVREATLTLVSGAVRIVVRDEKGDPVSDVGLIMDRRHEPVLVDYTLKGRVLRISGMFMQCPGLGDLPHGVIADLAPGPWTFEIYRTGYRAGRTMVDLRPGEVQDVVMVLQGDPEGRWDTWSREPRTRFDALFDLDAPGPPK